MSFAEFFGASEELRGLYYAEEVLFRQTRAFIEDNI